MVSIHLEEQCLVGCVEALASLLLSMYTTFSELLQAWQSINALLIYMRPTENNFVDSLQF